LKASPEYDESEIESMMRVREEQLGYDANTAGNVAE
jgi:hypothetical protein